MPKEITKDVPFDFLGYILTAEAVRRNTGANKIIHLLADVHAFATKSPDQHAEISQRLEECKAKYVALAGKLGLADHYELVMASDLEKDPAFQDIRQKIEISHLGIPDPAIPYVAQQMSDMAYMKRHQDVGIKLSWLVDPNAKKVGFDERFFDGLYKKVFTEDPLSYVYTLPGRSLNKEKSRVSPYVYTQEPQERLTLRASPENVVSFFRNMESQTGQTATAMKTHLSAIVELYETLQGPIAAPRLIDKVLAITDTQGPTTLKLVPTQP